MYAHLLYTCLMHIYPLLEVAFQGSLLSSIICPTFSGPMFSVLPWLATGPNVALAGHRPQRLPWLATDSALRSWPPTAALPWLRARDYQRSLGLPPTIPAPAKGPGRHPLAAPDFRKGSRGSGAHDPKYATAFGRRRRSVASGSGPNATALRSWPPTPALRSWPPTSALRSWPPIAALPPAPGFRIVSYALAFIANHSQVAFY